MDFLKQKKLAFVAVDIFKRPLTAAELGEICRKLGVRPREILRKKDAAYEKLGLDSGKHTDAQLLELMAKHPGLIQRPIGVRGDKAAVGRPVENLGVLA